MTSSLMFASLMLTDEITDKINILINKFINGWDLGQIEIGISSDRVDVSEFDFSQVEEIQMMWEDVAKLSINLIVDYQFYRQFSFESRYEIKEYNDRLLKLGYVFKDNCWKSVRKPEIKDAQTNIFIYFLYRIILDKMTLERDNVLINENEKRHLKLTEVERSTNDVSVEVLDGGGGTFSVPDSIIINRCSFCENEILYLETKCNACDATIEDIRDHLIGRERKSNENTLGLLRERSETDNIDKGTLEDVGRMGGGINNTLGKEEVKLSERNESKSNIVDNSIVVRREGKEKENINESRTSKTMTVKQEDTNKWKCERCMTENDCTSDHCRGCGSRNNNIKMADVDHGGRMDGGGDSVYVNGGGYNMEDRGGYNYDWTKDKARVKKWKCGGCELLNEYSTVTCVACNGLYKDGRWACGQCTVENSGDKDYCSVCNERNVNNIYTSDGCGQTDLERLKSDFKMVKEEYILAKKKENENINVTKRSRTSKIMMVTQDDTNKWKCGRCTTENDCTSDHCRGCRSRNNNIKMVDIDHGGRLDGGGDSVNVGEKSKVCHYCKKNRVTGTNVRCEDCVMNMNNEWKCGYSKCGIMNRNNDEYCWKCYFWRHNTYDRGYECRRQDGYGRINNGWICYKCDTVNDLTKSYCSKYGCYEVRYLKILCDKCQNYNDHILTNCWKCHNQLR